MAKMKKVKKAIIYYCLVPIKFFLVRKAKKVKKTKGRIKKIENGCYEVRVVCGDCDHEYGINIPFEVKVESFICRLKCSNCGYSQSTIKVDSYFMPASELLDQQPSLEDISNGRIKVNFNFVES